MSVFKCILLSAVLCVSGCGVSLADSAPGEKKIVIAHRGASGYLPEHTIAAKAMAYAQGADYIEQDLVMTRDDEVIVLHDHYLDTVTNVRDVFPGRNRDDGRYYVIDFTLAEIRQLAVYERFRWRDGAMHAVFGDRFPVGKSSFSVHTLAEEIELVQGLNESSGGGVGIYPEIKSPAFHRQEGKDISSAVLGILKSYGYTKAADNIFLQCFDALELRRIDRELMPRMALDLPLIQLLDTTADHSLLLTEEGLREISEYAVGIGPSMHLLVEPDSVAGNIRVTNIVTLAHAMGMQVHPYTFRLEADEIPPYAADFEDLLRIFLNQVGVDGVFTDFPDLAVSFVESEM